jgi:hypothetical protein
MDETIGDLGTYGDIEAFDCQTISDLLGTDVCDESTLSRIRQRLAATRRINLAATRAEPSPEHGTISDIEAFDIQTISDLFGTDTCGESALERIRYRLAQLAPDSARRPPDSARRRSPQAASLTPRGAADHRFTSLAESPALRSSGAVTPAHEGADGAMAPMDELLRALSGHIIAERELHDVSPS